MQLNYSNNNCIPEFLHQARVGLIGLYDGEFLLEWCEYFRQPKVQYIKYVHTTANCDMHISYVAQFEP